jgi:periplasmic protein TonB
LLPLLRINSKFHMKTLLSFVLVLSSTMCWSQTASTAQSSSTATADSLNKVYTTAEQMPQFPGGEKKMSDFLQKNIRYPAEARNKNIQGVVYVSFVVLSDGTLSDVKIVHGVEGGISEEAMRVVKKMPKWVPGVKNGKSVNVLVNLPVSFELTQE